ncbi:MAG: hypothetical protein JNK85_24695 [Verrucomicrobiales bacterium]|nr:hypothetical protein [Verrucomicrobiales bacterium]
MKTTFPLMLSRLWQRLAPARMARRMFALVGVMILGFSACTGRLTSVPGVSRENGPSGRVVKRGGHSYFEARDRTARLGPYYLPKPYLQIYVYESGLLGDRRPQVGYRAISIPDLSRPIYLEQNYTWASEDKVQVLFSEEGFLERVVYSREPKSADVAVAVGRAVASVLAPVPLPLPLKGIGDLPEYSRILFTTNLPLTCATKVEESFIVRTAFGRGEAPRLESSNILDPHALFRRLRRGSSLIAVDDVTAMDDFVDKVFGGVAPRSVLRDYLNSQFSASLRQTVAGALGRQQPLSREVSQALIDELNRLLDNGDVANEWQIDPPAIGVPRRVDQLTPAERRYAKRRRLSAEFPGVIRDIEAPSAIEVYFASKLSWTTRHSLSRPLNLNIAPPQDVIRAIANDWNDLLQSTETFWTEPWSYALRLPPGVERPNNTANLPLTEHARINRALLDEAFRGEIQRMHTEVIREHRFSVVAAAERTSPVCGAVAAAEPDPALDRVVGFYYRPLIPFTVSIEENIDREPAGVRLINAQSSIVYAPDCDRVEPFFLARAQVFARDQYDLRFSGGVLKEVSVSRESELLKFAEIPGRILGTVTSLPAELITVNVHHKNNSSTDGDSLSSDKDSGRTTPRREKE